MRSYFSRTSNNNMVRQPRKTILLIPLIFGKTV